MVTTTIELRINCFFENHAFLHEPKEEGSMRPKISCMPQNKTKKNRDYYMVRVGELPMCVRFCLLSS